MTTELMHLVTLACASSHQVVSMLQMLAGFHGVVEAVSQV